MKMSVEQIGYQTILNSYGDCVELNYNFDSDSIIEYLKTLNYIDGPNGKRGLNLTGPIDDLGLETSKQDKHNADQSYNTNLTGCPELVKFFDLWDGVARCRAVNMNSGSFFRMHRDAFKDNPQFRIFIPLNFTESYEWRFMYEEGELKFKPGKPYILNTRKSHGSFAMVDGIYHVLMSCHLTEHNFKRIAELLPNVKDHN